MRFVTILKRVLAGLFPIAVGVVIVLIVVRIAGGPPWAPIDPAAPIDALTGRKLAALGQAPAQCRALLTLAGVGDRRAPAIAGPGRCGYADGETIVAQGARAIAYRPAVTTRCAVAAGTALWEWDVVQPAAIRWFGVPVRAIDHFGSYNCRHIAGSPGRAWSEHATGNAIDIAAFRLADGRRVSIAADWNDRGARGQFLHAVRDGACRLFATVLSPDYNTAHHDHLHIDQADRGAIGWRACR